MKRAILSILILATIVAALTVLVLAFSSGAVDAAKGGHGRGHVVSLGDPTLYTLPGSPYTSRGFQYEVHGDGYEQGTVYIVASEPYCCAFWSIWPDDNGHIWWERLTQGPGTYQIDAYQRNGGGNLYLQGSVAFDVTE